MKPKLLFTMFAACTLACAQTSEEEPLPEKTQPIPITKVSDIPVPPDAQRVMYPAGTYARWLQDHPILSRKTIKTFSGATIPPAYYKVVAVFDRPLLFAQDLEQCADFAMRLWADYHKESDRLSSLYLFTYAGERRPFGTYDGSYTGFLKHAFATSNSFSLKQGCRIVESPEVEVGDLLVQNRDGGIGHVTVLIDECITADSTRLFLAGFSFMPAQEFHIESARGIYGTGDWFTLDGLSEFLTEFLDVGEPVFRRW